MCFYAVLNSIIIATMKKPYNSRPLITAILLAVAIAYGPQSHAQSVMNIIPDTPADTVAIQKALHQPDNGPFDVKAVLSVYPDVPTGNVNIKWENQPKGIATVNIIDTAGTPVLSTTIKINTPSGKTQVDLSTLKNGEYHILINSEKISFTGKLTVLP